MTSAIKSTPLNFSRRAKLPVIIQTEAVECGLACLTMISKYHGHDVDLNGMRARHPVSMKGATLETLIDLAADMDLGSRALRLELEELDQLQLPAILHWDLNHFVVLKSVRGDKIVIHDPATGERRLTLAQASDHFTGVALELMPTARFEKQTARKTMKLSSLWQRLIGLKRAIIQTLILSIVLQLIVLASPFYLQLVIDEAVVKFDTRLLLMLALGFGALAVIRVTTEMMRSWLILYFGHQMSYQMVANIFRHLIHLPTDYFEKRHVGDVISRIGSTQPIQTALTQSLVAALIDGLMAIITGVVLFIYSPLLGTIVLVSVVLMLVATLLMYPILRRRQEEAILTSAREQTHVIESIRASTTIKLFSAQNLRVSNWRNLFADTINADVSFGKNQIILTAVHGLVSGVQTVLVVYFGARLILDGEVSFTIGMLFAFMSYRMNFTQSATSLLNKIIEFRLLGLHLERIADISQAEPESTTAGAVLTPGDTRKPAVIELRNVRFRYSDGDPWVLDGVDLKIEAGEFVALTGPSGGGKTTLLKLMLGLYLPTEGQILIDGHPMTEASRMNWRKRIGVVMQDDQLLTGTLAENISFFDPDMDMARVQTAAQQAFVHDDVMAMPMGYLSMIGDMGSSLSGGQKQRVLLARALYRQPSTIFLDEGTANIDAETERLIVDFVEASPMTRIVVAHRQEFISRADRVVTIGMAQKAQTQPA
ncbi:MAG: peptidase domain-containing ABC transporter [Litorimonas sp.]